MSHPAAPSFKDHLLTNLLRVLPQHLLARGMYKLTRSKHPKVKDFLIHFVSEKYHVNIEEALEPDTDTYESFNAFFTRALRENARPIADAKLVSPADGKISQFGDINHDQLLQAKGHNFDLLSLLAGDKNKANAFIDGSFATVYLSPRDYHRVHMPCTGTLTSMTFVPGDLFSVSEATTQIVDGLFARNERLICYFDTEFGPMAVILVGAIFVGSMQTVWAGEITGPSDTPTRRVYHNEERITLEKGEEMGRFNMGSTVVTLLPKDAIEWQENLQLGDDVQMGIALSKTD